MLRNLRGLGYLLFADEMLLIYKCFNNMVWQNWGYHCCLSCGELVWDLGGVGVDEMCNK